MRGKDLLECMECIDDALIQEALEPTAAPHKKLIAARWSAAAACIIVVGISAAAFWPHQSITDEQMDSASPMAMDTSGNDNTASLPDSNLTAGAVAETTQADTDEFEEDRAADTVRQDSAADALSGKASTKLQDGVEDLKMHAEEETAKLAYTIISDYYGEKDDSVYDYPVPDKGSFFCYHYLQKTMEYYAALEETADTADSPIYAYDVVIDVFGDVETDSDMGSRYEQLNMLEGTNAGNELIEQEYRRLTELGYAVRLSEDFQLTGIFTKVELDTFQALPEYGYTFRFADEY